MATKKIDVKGALQGALDKSIEAGVNATNDRFSHAAQVVQSMPHGLVAKEQTSADHDPRIQVTKPFEPANFVVGTIVSVPLRLIDENHLSPRRMYTNEVIDKIAKSMPSGQDVAAHGFVRDGRIKLIDGGTRLRAAKISAQETLDVKIEPAPVDDLSLFMRARELNESRSEATALDFALSLQMLIDNNIAANGREISQKIPGPEGGLMAEATVSMYLSIASMPERVIRKLSEHPKACALRAMYSLSTLFRDVGTDDEQFNEVINFAFELIDQIEKTGMTRQQIEDAVKGRMQGPKTRQRSVVHPIVYGRFKGKIKTFEKKGQIDMTVGGLTEDQLPIFREKLDELVKTFSGA